MNTFATLTAALCLQLICAPFAPAAAQKAPAGPLLGLTHDPGPDTIEVSADADLWTALLIGPRLESPIVIEGEQVQVAPHLALSLGFMAAGERRTLAIPAGFRVPGGEVGVQAVGFAAESWRFLASAAVFLTDADGHDFVRRTLRAALLSTDSIPPWWTLDVSLVAPTSGYRLDVDGVDHEPAVTHVYLRLTGPAADEQVMQVEEEHRASADLGKEPGTRIEVWLMRQRRGGTDLPFYERMLVLDRKGDADGDGTRDAARK